MSLFSSKHTFSVGQLFNRRIHFIPFHLEFYATISFAGKNKNVGSGLSFGIGVGMGWMQVEAPSLKQNFIFSSTIKGEILVNSFPRKWKTFLWCMYMMNFESSKEIYAGNEIIQSSMAENLLESSVTGNCVSYDWSVNWYFGKFPYRVKCKNRLNFLLIRGSAHCILL